MKKSLLIAALLAVALAGCQKRETPTSQGTYVAQATNTDEVCYDGVVYVNFGSGNSQWGSVKFDRTGAIVTCGV